MSQKVTNCTTRKRATFYINKSQCTQENGYMAKKSAQRRSMLRKCNANNYELSH